MELSLYNDVLNTLKTACLTLEGDGALAHKVGRMFVFVILYSACLRIVEPITPNNPRTFARLSRVKLYSSNCARVFHNAGSLCLCVGDV